MTDSTVQRHMPFDITRSAGDGLTLEGYAAVFDSPTRIDSWEGQFDEQILRGAFAKTLRERTPVLQFDHGSHPLIGSIPLGAITRLAEDSRGLHVKARLSDNWLIQPVRDAIRDGAVNGMSFRFRVINDTWDHDRDLPLRTLTEVALHELGPVVFPAYADTAVGVRSDQLAVQVAEQLQSIADRSRPDAPVLSTTTEAAPGTSDVAAPADEPADATRRTAMRQTYRRVWGTSPTTPHKEDQS